MTALTARQREIFTTSARIVSHKKAAEQLGITEACLRGQLSRIRMRMEAGVVIGEPGETAEPRETARARVMREVDAGARCPRCWLMLPCDHGGAT